MSENHRLNRRLLLVIFFLFVLSLACSSPLGNEGSEKDAVITEVAQTLAAEADPADPPLPSPTLTPQVTNTPSLPEPDILYQGVSFSYEEMADSVNVETIPYQPEGPSPNPEYLRFILSGYVLPDAYHEPSFNVYPVEAYREVSEFAGELLQEMDEFLEDPPANLDRMVGVGFPGAAEFIGCQYDYVDFQNGQGVRYVTQWGQAAFPIGYPHMFYNFRGLTEDGRYFIRVIMPVNHPSLPDAESVTMDQEFYNNYVSYAAEMEAQLNQVSPDSFVPSLLALDAMVETLLVVGE